MLNFIRKLLSKLYRKLGISADLGYIGTGVSLPPPLSKEEELRLTLLFTNADDSPAARETAEQAKNTLIEHNHLDRHDRTYQSRQHISRGQEHQACNLRKPLHRK